VEREVKRVLALALVAACGTKQRGEPPIELVFGDCASIDTPFVVGPRPQADRPWNPPLPMLPEPPPPDRTVGKPNPYAREKLEARAMSPAQIWWVLRHRRVELAQCWTTRVEGTVELSFDVTPWGMLRDVSARGIDEPTARCVRQVVSTLTFPRASASGTQHVVYPLTFRAGSDDPTDPNPPPPERPIDRSYIAGVQTLLAPLTPGLTDCLRGNFGAGVIDIADLTLRSHGESAEVAACIEKLAGVVRATNPQRCSYAWSRIPGGGLARVDVSPGGVTTGQPVPQRESTAPLTRIGPTVVTATADVPMTDVNKVLRTLRKGGFDTVFAQRRSDLVATGTLAHPLVPVPVDTGVRWDQVASPAVRIQIRRAGIFVGEELVPDDALVAVLRKHRATATDLQIGALDVDAARVFTVIAAADEVGFDYVVVPYEDL
jgi:hypothetical protein